MNRSTFNRSMWKLAGLLALLAALAWQPALAQDETCLADIVPGVTCSGKDVKIAELQNVNETTSCMPGEDVELELRAKLVSTAFERYDVGMFVALDGGSAETGSCHHAYLPPPLLAGGTCSVSGGSCTKDPDCPHGETCRLLYNPGSPDASGGPFYNAEPDDTGDSCGDLEKGRETYYDLPAITVPCIDSDGDGYLDVGTAASWDNQRTHTCTGVNDTLPNTPAKCKFETVRVGNVVVPPGAIQVTKSAEPTELYETGGDVRFTFTVSNTSEVTITLDSLVDSVYESLHGKGTCSVPQTLPAHTGYDCAITATVEGDLGVHRDTVTASGLDWYQAPVSDTATAEVLIVDLPPVISVTKAANPTTVPEPGGIILYTVTVTNDSAPSDPVTLTSLEDSVYGDLTKIAGSTCRLDEIQPGKSLTCRFEAPVSGVGGNSIGDTVTATGIDDEGEEASASDDATVTIIPVPPDTGVGLPAVVVGGGAAAIGLALVSAGTLLRRRTR